MKTGGSYSLYKEIEPKKEKRKRKKKKKKSRKIRTLILHEDGKFKFTNHKTCFPDLLFHTHRHLHTHTQTHTPHKHTHKLKLKNLTYTNSLRLTQACVQACLYLLCKALDAKHLSFLASIRNAVVARDEL